MAASRTCTRLLPAAGRRAGRTHPRRPVRAQALAPGVSVSPGEPSADGKVRVAVTVSGEETKRVYDEVVENLKEEAPDIPGFPKRKGGKGVDTKLVPTSTIVMMLGKKNIVGFTVEKIVSETLKDFVDEQGLSAENEIKCTEERKELTRKFKEGESFSFEADLQLSADELAEGGLA